MSNEEKGKRPMSFEDAIKKAVTTPADPAIMIEKKDKKYTIPHAAGKKVLFTWLTIHQRRVDRFIVKAIIRSGNEEFISHYFPTIHPNQKSTDTAALSPADAVPLSIPKNASLSVAVINSPSFPDEDFEVGSLSYRILG